MDNVPFQQMLVKPFIHRFHIIHAAFDDPVGQCRSGEFYTQLFLKNGLVWKLDTEVGTTNQLLPMIECNLGIGFLADFLARNAIETGRVFQIPLCMEMPEREILLVEDKTRRLSIAANRFKKMLIDYSNGLCR